MIFVSLGSRISSIRKQPASETVSAGDKTVSASDDKDN